MREIVFDPGYTSKFDAFGTPSTGIGLSYVRELVQELGGHIQIEPKETKKVQHFCLSFLYKI
ncbi:hypothetical protein BsIDN1_04770 [Bacillus safensis]|uniref:Histidine kinase/HSP90-like ATPase domain-containing protein n=1 Tax=Bacillus safensis TaxID=561879 RepID=A0A5S9M4M8_BACIA|nr:hypothetical protein BsIDN1_04770 [Bacillus safensis]